MVVSNVLGIIIGVVMIIVGFILLVTWWAIFVKAIMAIVPILLILIGAGALIYFISEIKSKLEMVKETPTSAEEKKTEQK
jgi:flagellar motor component MotA